MNKLFCICFGFLIFSCTYKKADLDPVIVKKNSAQECDTTGVISYAKDIVPIMNTSCGAQDNACHTSSVASGQVILDLQLGVNFIALDGRLMSSIIWDGGTSFMPKSGQKLPTCDIMKIRRWITEGAPDN